MESDSIWSLSQGGPGPNFIFCHLMKQNQFEKHCDLGKTGTIYKVQNISQKTSDLAFNTYC
jgi:hypothetical protein